MSISVFGAAVSFNRLPSWSHLIWDHPESAHFDSRCGGVGSVHQIAQPKPNSTGITRLDDDVDDDRNATGNGTESS
jgi:hypothetical protein